MTPDHHPVSSSTTPPATGSVALTRLLAMAVGVRVFNDTGIQIFAPYLGVISAGLGISIVSLGFLVSLRSLMGLATPVIGSIADSVGYRPTMRGLLLAGAAGMFVVGVSWRLWIAAAGILITGLGVLSFPPVLQAYMSAQIPYERRSRGLGVIEYGWALAGILGLSVSGLLIARFGWRAPFLGLSVALLGAFFLFGAFPAAPGRHSRTSAGKAMLQWREWPRRFFALIHLESNTRSAWTAILVNGLNVFAATNVSIVYGVWLTREYDVTTTRLGLVALALGLSELSGSVLVSLIGDRLGKYRSIVASSACGVVAYLLLPFLNVSVLAVVPGLLIARFLFEVGIVSNISLLSEQVPSQRGKVLALASATVTTCVAAANITGPLTYSTWGIIGPALAAAGAVCIAAILMVRWVDER